VSQIWFPGHMAKTRRLMRENLRLANLIWEVVDSRIPWSGRNPDIGRIAGDKTRFVVLNKADLADPKTTAAWRRHLTETGEEAFEVDALSGAGCRQLLAACEARSPRVGPLRVMVVGIPNSGKSSLINRMAGRKSAPSGALPGVTRGKQWVMASDRLEILDLPGVLSPRKGGRNLVMRQGAVGALDERAIDPLEVALYLLASVRMEEGLRSRFGIEATGDPQEDLRAVAARLGCLRRGGKVDMEKAAILFLKDYRDGRLGRYTLESPGEAGR